MMITGMPNTTYKPGKLYRIKDYPWEVFTVWTAKGVGNPAYRKKLFDVNANNGELFLYVKFIADDRVSPALHLVIFRDTVGVIDARMELEEFVPLSEGSHEPL